MSNHVINDQIASLYADGVEHVWSSWEPSLARCERLLGNSDRRNQLHSDELAHRFRRAQYQAHVASEFAAGLAPPAFAAASHDLLVASLATCRDTLSVIALRAELEELDDETALIGLLAIDSTRSAVRGTRLSRG
jgi:hypothetical protein